MSAKTLMVLGSMSGAGKSLLVTGLCRLYARRGVRVAPFKAQNMSNNAAVCSGGEIGRAQAVQARAAGLEPTVDMNPVLLKPESGSHCQAILRGRVWNRLEAGDYTHQRQILWRTVTESLDTLRQQFALVIMEGAGSAAELNLSRTDIVNFAAAHHAAAPCLLVGDIDRGGIFAQLLGTLALLEPEHRRMVRGLVVNKFRGDRALFEDGVAILQERDGLPVLGVVPWLGQHGIPDEDAATISEFPVRPPGALDAAIIHLPHISNFDDFDPLRFEPGVQLRHVRSPDHLGRPGAILLPGSKNTLSDLRWLHETGLAGAIRDCAARGVAVVGLCGGFQMLGREVVDEEGIESPLRQMPGLELLPVRTRLARRKTVTRSRGRIRATGGWFDRLAGAMVVGYEIHQGRSESDRPLFDIVEREGRSVARPDGAASPEGRVWGSYLHGVLDNDNLRRAWLTSLGVLPAITPFADQRIRAFDALADALEASLDIPRLDRIIEEGPS